MASIRFVYVSSALLLLSWLGGGAPARAYYGPHATEAMLAFEAMADVPLSGVAGVESINREGARRARALELVDGQVQHLMGTFQSESFRAEFGWPGVLGEGYQVRFTGVAEGSAPGRKLLSYEFRGKVVFQKEAFSGHATRVVPLKLPLAADLIFDLGLVRGKNACTDRHYDTEGDFWYFWDPEMPGCPLAGNDVDVLRVRGRLERLGNSRVEYPEYDRLYGDNGNGEALEISVFLGYIDDLEDLVEPRRRDAGAVALRHVEAELRAQGFERAESLDAFREYADGRIFPGINFHRVYEKSVATDTGRSVLARVKLLLSDTSVGSPDLTFHHHLVPALERSDIVVYDGHSGLGANLDLGSLRSEVRFDRSKFQVFFFNGCSSYPYFNRGYFDAKGGSRNLDIVLSGLPTYVDSAGPNVVAFLSPFLGGRALSYQAMLRELERSNGENGTYLTGVVGEHDNRWTPGTR